MDGEDGIGGGGSVLIGLVCRIVAGWAAPTFVGLPVSSRWKRVLLHPDGNPGCDPLGIIL